MSRSRRNKKQEQRATVAHHIFVYYQIHKMYSTNANSRRDTYSPCVCVRDIAYKKGLFWFACGIYGLQLQRNTNTSVNYRNLSKCTHCIDETACVLFSFSISRSLHLTFFFSLWSNQMHILLLKSLTQNLQNING